MVMSAALPTRKDMVEPSIAAWRDSGVMFCSSSCEKSVMLFVRISASASSPLVMLGAFCMLRMASCFSVGVLLKYCSLLQELIGAVR